MKLFSFYAILGLHCAFRNVTLRIIEKGLLSHQLDSVWSELASPGATGNMEGISLYLAKRKSNGKTFTIFFCATRGRSGGGFVSGDRDD